jgi:asparagine synthase (glutamine-hydrolysing)
MCGIAVLFDKSENIEFSERHKIVDKMQRAIMHRGNDNISIRNYKSCMVGFNRLAITEIKNNQPSQSDWIVYLNGEIYNYKDLGFEGSEVDVIAKGLKYYGFSFINRLNGIFVITAIYGNQVFIIRDRYGCKPVYYWHNYKQIVIASEIKAIITHPDYKLRINESAERQWLVFNNILTDETLFDGIYKLDKGTIWHLNTKEKIKFWKWHFNPQRIDIKEATEQTKSLLTKSVNKQYPKEVDCGIFASGGVDSSVLRYLLPDINTYTACFPSYDVDESDMAKLMDNGKGQYINFDHIVCFDETIKALDDLRVGSSWTNYVLYNKAKQNGLKVILDGAGSDELFGGYPWRYKGDNYYDVINRTKKYDEYCIELYKSMHIETIEDRFLFDCNHFLEGVLSVGDKLGMANTIEVRVPFLDNDLVDFCITLPIEFKKNKLILKQAFKGLLPDAILEGKKKGFSSPDWIKGEGNQANKWANESLNKWKQIYAAI